jgi:heme exporter protein B
MIARARTSGTLFTVLSLPLLLPLLIAAIQGSTAAASGDHEAAVASLKALIGLGGAMTVVSVWLFPVVWDE